MKRFKNKILRCGFIILAGMTFLLFFLKFVETIRQGAVALSIFNLFLLGGLALVMKVEYTCYVSPKCEDCCLDKNDLFSAVAVVVGAFVCYVMSTDLGLGAVLSAGVVGMLSVLVAPKYAVPAYCGAFVGMASSELLPTHFHLLLAAVVAGAIFAAAKLSFNGFGGKLGTIAFTGCIVAALLTGQSFLSAPVPTWDIGGLLIVYSILGAVITRVFSIRLKHGAVMASSVVGLLGGLILPALHPEVGSTLAVMVICASFAGMSSADRIPNEVSMAVAGLIAALVFMFTSPYLGGAGGKLGTIAFGSVIALLWHSYEARNHLISMKTWIKTRRIFNKTA
jgi:hypothetical protein